MTNTELIRQEIERLKAELPPQDLHTTVGADSIRIANKYDEILSFIDSLPKETPQGWISVKDRLPENDDYVLTCSNINGTPPYVGLHYYNHKESKWLLNEYAYPVTVDYWMPIPKFKEE